MIGIVGVLVCSQFGALVGGVSVDATLRRGNALPLTCEGSTGVDSRDVLITNVTEETLIGIGLSEHVFKLIVAKCCGISLSK